ncbi:hypothetical protein, partial [Streptococcus salivarius]|uniref:hypothetical protein n=1 Tax=Streptococcus salivarius TaxID=1304 RepID=UPI001D0827CC
CDTAAELKIRQAWFLDHPFSQGLIQHAGMIGAPPIVYPVTAFYDVNVMNYEKEYAKKLTTPEEAVKIVKSG